MSLHAGSLDSVTRRTGWTKMRSQHAKVLYVAGVARSGSTLLSMVLGQIPSWFDGGELRRLWQRGLIQHQRCGCGVPVDECPVWSKIIHDAFGGTAQVPLAKIIEADSRLLRTRHLPLHIANAAFLHAGMARNLEYMHALRQLYESIGSATSSNVIVDSSKHPVYAAMLRSIPTLDVYVLHLVRNPLGVVHSRQQVKTNPASGESMGGVHPFVSGSLWSITNGAIEHLLAKSGQYLQLNYEEFAADPRGSLIRIIEFIGESPAVLGSIKLDGRRVMLSPTHSASGNPMRFDAESVEIRSDERWRTGLSTPTKMMVRVLTAPIAARYSVRRSVTAGPRVDCSTV